MRGAALLAATLGMLLPGCLSAGGDAGPDAPLRAFEARYGLTLEGPDGTTPVEGALLLRLSGPEPVADRDGQIRPAYVLESRRVLWEPGAFHRPPDDAPRVVHRLGGDLLLVRTDCLDGLTAGPMGCGPGMPVVDWTVKGAPSPFGLFWGDEVRSHLDGHWEEFGTDLGQGRHGLPPGNLVPWGPADQHASVEFEPGPHGVPTSFAVTDRHGELAQTMRGRLLSLTLGDGLPPIDPWPMPEADAVDALRFRFLPGESEEAFGMGLSFEEGFGQLLNQSAPAGEAFRAACGVSGTVHWSGGARPGNAAERIVFGNGDWIRFRLDIAGQGVRHTWSWNHQEEPPLRDLAQKELLGEVVDEGEAGPAACPIRQPQAVLGVNDFLRAGWQLGLASGVPCNVLFGGYQFAESGSMAIVESGLRLQSTLSGPVSNSPWDHAWEPEGFGILSYNAEDGRMDWLMASAQDLVDLDAGRLVARELPSEPRDLLGAEGYRCVPPSYTEPVGSP